VFEKQNLSGKTKLGTYWTDAIMKDLRESKPRSLSQFYELAERMDLEGQRIPKNIYKKNREADHVSHFILRLAYCRNEELRRWFVNHETDLFRFRYGLMKDNCPEELFYFMIESGLSYERVDDLLKKNLMADLLASLGYGWNSQKIERETFYKVPWTNQLNLVMGRRVFIINDMAYIPSSEIPSLVVGIFRIRLSHNLVLTQRVLPVLKEDTRLYSLLQNLDKRLGT
jgi:DNA primase large subunit